MWNYGSRIKQSREKANMTQEELGRKIGVTGVTIMRYEKNQREPRLDILERIATVLNVHPSFLAGLDPVVDTPENREAVDKGFISFGKAIESLSKGKRRQPKVEEIASYLLEDPSDEDYLLMAFDELNDKGKRIAIERVQELAKIPEYQEKNTQNEFSKAQRVIHGTLPKEGDSVAVDPQEND